MSQPSSAPISPLRRRMLEDMAMRGLREDTQHDYIMSCGASRPSSGDRRDSDSRGRPSLPGPSGRQRGAAAHHQQFGVGAALPVHRDARPAGPVAAPRPGA